MEVNVSLHIMCNRNEKMEIILIRDDGSDVFQLQPQLCVEGLSMSWTLPILFPQLLVSLLLLPILKSTLIKFPNKNLLLTLNY